MRDEEKINWSYKLLVWAIGVFVALGTAVNGFTVTQLVALYREVGSLDKRVVAIESNRFTSVDAIGYFKTLADKIDELEDDFTRNFVRKDELRELREK